MLIICRCTTEDSPILENNKVLYFTSFENDLDVQWYEGMKELADDAAPGGGQRSLFINGGCVVPHLIYKPGPYKRDMLLEMSLWGRTDRGGSVFLMAEGGAANAVVDIGDAEWTFYESEEAVYVPAGEKVLLSFVSGGFVGSSTFFDLLEIRDCITE